MIARRAGSDSTAPIAAASSGPSAGGTVRAASPVTSTRLAAVEHTTGVPHAIASSTGSPKPSCQEG